MRDGTVPKERRLTHSLDGEGVEYSHPSSPYERSVRHIETKTGQPRTLWEPKREHPLVERANKLARRIAKIPEKQNPMVGRRWGKSYFPSTHSKA